MKYSNYKIFHCRMSKKFFKTKDCSCVVVTIACGIKKTEKGPMYLIGGHKYFTICKKCKELEESEDTLYDMWMNDNITDDFEYGGWKLDPAYVAPVKK